MGPRTSGSLAGMVRPTLLAASLQAFSAAGCEGSVSDEGNGGFGGEGTVSVTSGSPTSTGSKATSATTSTTGSPTGSTNATTGPGGDPYAASRAACINKINELRATKGLPAYGQWTAAESCSDQQATADETSGQAHGAFGMC